jgi:hypothetical protein
VALKRAKERSAAAETFLRELLEELKTSSTVSFDEESTSPPTKRTARTDHDIDADTSMRRLRTDVGYTSVMLISQETSNTCTTSEADPALVHDKARRSVDLTTPVDLEARLQASSPEPSVPKKIGYMHRYCVAQATKCPRQRGCTGKGTVEGRYPQRASSRQPR